MRYGGGDMGHGGSAVVAEHFDLQALVKSIRARKCIRTYPVVFWRSFALGAVAAVAGILGAVGYYQVSTPIFRPTLQLVSNVIPSGGSLQFVQAASPARPCPQESTRAVWWWETPEQTRAQLVILNNSGPAPRVWDGPTTVNIPLPDLPPGTYYYMRETTSWCSLFNYLLATPTVEKTHPVRFEIVSSDATTGLRTRPPGH